MNATLTAGFDHVATVTRDLDRLIHFYDRLLDVGFEELADPRGRHGFFWLTPGCAQHVFEVPEAYTGPFPTNEMMRRGRIDHLAIAASGEAALAEIRDRAVALGASDGTITRFGGVQLSLHVVDPDGQELEVCCPADGTVFGPDDYEDHELG